MKRIFLDTNIVLDMLIREEYQSDMRNFIVQTCNEELFISYLTVANAAYVMRKYPKGQINRNINLLLQLFNIISNDKSQIEKAIQCESKDFEDMLQYQAAVSAKCEVIITRNGKDFDFSEIPVMTVNEFLSK